MATSINFTKAAIEALPLPSPGKRNTYLDSKISGLQLRITSNGIITFSVYRRTKGGGPERVTVGRYPATTIEQARRKAAEINASIAGGGNPADRARAARREMTLDDLFNEYMTRRAAFNRRPDKPQKQTIGCIFLSGANGSFPRSGMRKWTDCTRRLDARTAS